eukprot:gnl/Hemi2/9584_TR3327_c0_g1_i1.p1 gnl/Hemi2/9584_TR3327_c0_g1~~gnl/Hemi2/9584_TR3327_c0_g1_i1.p1  ORF type:complete len:102 (-),score=0.79 gnl/Hemi2/9584_TR3327_c0_g1_i1:158-463(-)
MSQRSKLFRVHFTFADGIDNAQSGEPGYILDNNIQSQIEQPQILLHFARSVRSLLKQICPVPAIGSELLGRFIWKKASAQESKGVEVFGSIGNPLHPSFSL